MPANAQVYQTTSITNATIVTTAETIVATIPSVNIDTYGYVLRIDGMIALTTPADSTGVSFKVRRNTVTGTQVGSTITYPTIAAVAYAFDVSVIAAQPVGQHTYVITVTVADASANTTVAAVVVTATVGN